MTLVLEYIGTYWPFGGDLFTMSHPDGRQARVFVDSLGETWVDIRRIPVGGYFHTDRVDAYQAFNGSVAAGEDLQAEGFGKFRLSPFAFTVRERGI